MAERIACSLVEWAVQIPRSNLTAAQVSVHCCLSPAACMRDVQKEGLLYTHLYSVHLY